MTTSGRTGSRLGWTVLLVLPTVAIAATAAGTVRLAPRIAAEIAIHWGTGGRPNGHLSLAWLTGLLLGGAVLAVVHAARTRARGTPTATVMLLIVGMVLGAHWATLEANLDAASWREANLSLGRLFALLLAGGVGGVIAGLFVDSSVPPHAGSSSGPRASAAGATAVRGSPVLRGTRAVWVTEATPTRLGKAATVGMVAGVGVLTVASGQLGITSAAALAGVLVVLLMFARVRLSVAASGVAVRFGPFGWPLIRVPLAGIRSADVVEVEPMQFGGWGYRVRGRTRAVVTRRGPALRLSTDRRDLLVTIADADQAAAVVNNLLEPAN